MKKFTVIICLLVSIVASGQYTGPGFYRVHNVNTDSYICIKDTAYKWSSKPDAFWSCIKMLPAQSQEHLSDPGSLIYIPYLEQTSLYAQGVDTYMMTELYMDVEPAKAQEGGLATYVAKTKKWITMNDQDVLFTCYFRDQGTGLTAGSSDNIQSRWWIEPVNEESIETSFFGVQPVSEDAQDQDGWYWATLTCDFPFLIPVDGGVEGAYTVKQVNKDEDGNWFVNPVKVYSQGEVVPAATPVLLKCQNATVSGNKLIPTGEIANNTTLPLKNDLLMGNYFSTFTNHSSLTDASVMSLYVPVQATMAAEQYLALGVDADGKLGFFPQAEGTYMAANTTWLSTEGLDCEGATAIYIHEAVVEEIIIGDANGDGQVSVNDVTVMIDDLLYNKSSKAAGRNCFDVNGLLLVNVTATDDVYPTLIQHAREHKWRITIEDRMAPPAGWRGDGVIVQAMDWPVVTRYVKSLMHRGIPVVNLVNSRIGNSLSTCAIDMRQVGKVAAAHFRERNFRHVAFFTMEWLHGRKLVSDSLKEAMDGCDTELLAWPFIAPETQINNRSAMVKWLKGKLRSAPKPIAVLCPNAYNAVTFLNVCLDMGLTVPDEVSVLSGQYDPAFCDCQAVPISGIEIDTRRQAIEAATLLDRLIDGSAHAHEHILIPPTRVVVQQSTDVLATKNPLLRRAFKFIRENLSRPFGAAEIAASLDVPRIRLDRLFAAEFNRSAGKEILRQRIERAKQLLVETDDTLATIASSCGFCHASYLVNTFKKATGTTPHRYRRGKREPTAP